MVERIIELSVRYKWAVFGTVAALALFAADSARKTPLDALPDLSDPQVIIYTEWMGRSPDLVEDQITYPLVRALQSTPGVQSVRGYSMFGMSFTYALFSDGTDIYWARTRVLEQLGRVQQLLPPGVTPTLGPDASGIGWVYQYVLKDATGRLDLAELAGTPGLHRSSGAAGRRWRRRGRVTGRLRTAVPDHRGPRQAGGIRPDAHRHHALGARFECRGGRARARARGPRVRAARPRVYQGPRGSRAQRRDGWRRRHAGSSRRHRRGAVRPRHPPRGCGLQRNRRSRRRHRRHAHRLERTAGDRGGQKADRAAAAARGRAADPHLRSLRPDSWFHRHTERHPPSAGRDRRDHLPGLPVPCAIRARRHAGAAPVGAVLVHRDPLPGIVVEHHVAWRDRDRRRGAGRRGHRADRKRPCAARRRAAWLGPPANHRRCVQGSRTSDFLLAAADHRQLPPHLHAGRASGPAVHASRLYEDVRDVFGSHPVDHARSTVDGAVAEGSFPYRGDKSGQPLTRRHLPTRGHGCRPLSLCGCRGRHADDDRHRAGLPAARIGVHAAARRRHAARHAHHVPRHRDRRSSSRPPAAEPDDQKLRGSRVRARQGRPRRNRDRPGTARHDRDRNHAASTRRMAVAACAPLVQRLRPRLGEAGICRDLARRASTYARRTVAGSRRGAAHAGISDGHRTANPYADRHAVDRCSHARGRQGLWRRPERDRTRQHRARRDAAAGARHAQHVCRTADGPRVHRHRAESRRDCAVRADGP